MDIFIHENLLERHRGADDMEIRRNDQKHSFQIQKRKPAENYNDSIE